MTGQVRRQRHWWTSRFVDRELIPALTFGFFVYLASGDWMWAAPSFWACGMVMLRFDELLDAINDK